MPPCRQFLLTLTIIGSLAGCVAVPLDVPKEATLVIPDNSDTEFGQLAEGWARDRGTASGFYPFVYGLDALGARLEMANRAQASIDLQYFLMKNDAAGALMADALWRAADRGVRVRFLLDDVFTSTPDSHLLALNAHPNVQVRLFNPISRRGLHSLNFVGHFRRANRRMHNKSFTVDNAIGIVGGRNIADEYFQLREDAVFADFDVLAFGPIMQHVSESFDSYWNHRLAVPIEQLVSDRDRAKAERLLSESPEFHGADEIYSKALNSELVRRLASGEQALFEAEARVIADDPDKLQRAVGEDNRQLANELGRILQAAESELLFVTPYYVPGRDGVDFARGLVEKGLRVVMVTNSLASTNHIPVHSAYSSYRRRVLQSGVELYEARANSGREATNEQGPERLTLHTKLIVIDRRYVFVGSLNLDPRSIDINAEMGLLIDSPELAGLIAEGLDADLPTLAYRVVAPSRRQMEWHTTINGQPTVETSEPLSSRWRRFKAWFLRIAPERQL